MPALRNPKHEKVALALFAGQDNDGASAAAGYDAKASSFSANANKRAQRHGIPERVAELRAPKDAADIERAEIKKEWLLAQTYDGLQFNIDDYLGPANKHGFREFKLDAPRHILGRLAELSIGHGQYGSTIKIKGNDKLGLMRFAAELQGFLKQKHEHAGPDGGPMSVINKIEQVIVDPQN